MLHGARQVAEPDIDEFDLVVADELQYLVGVREHQPSLQLAKGPARTGVNLPQDRLGR